MNPTNESSRTSDFARQPGLTLLAGAAAMLLALTGCEDKSGLSKGGNMESPAPVAAAPKPAEESAPPRQEERRAPDVDALAGLDLNPKVEFPRFNEPSSKDIAEAVAALAGAIAEGDSRGLHQMLDSPNQAILDDLVESGVWQDSTGSITNIRICSLEEDGQSLRVGLGVEDREGAYLLGWSGERIGGGWLFSGIALDTPASAMTASELDGGSLAAREIPEPGAIIDEEFDPTINDPRRGDDNRRRRGSRRGGGGGGRRGLR